MYYMRPSMGERGETVHFSIPSINQSGSFGSIFLALATPSTMVPTMPKAIFPFGYTLWTPLTVPLGFAPVCYLYNSQLYWSKKLYNQRLVKRRWFCRADGGGGFLFEQCYIHVMVYVKLRTDVMWDYLIGLKERIRPTPPENQGGIYRLDGKYT